LAWQAATQRPDLMAEPVAAALPSLATQVFVAAIEPALADTAAFCAAYEVAMDASANCVVVEGRRGDLTTMAACLVLATDRADVNRAVRRRLGARKISFAAMESAISRTGMEYGGITPLGLPGGWPLLVDAAVAASHWLVVGSGLRSSKLAVTGATLAALPGAEVLPLALPR